MNTIRIEVSFRTLVAAVLLFALVVAPVALAAVAGTASRWSGNQLIFDGSSGNDAEKYDVDGLRLHLGTGSDDFIDSNGTYLRVGSSSGGYLASATPETIASVYVNNTISAFTYGGGTLSAHALTVTDIAYSIRTVGSGGIDGGITDNNTFEVSDGTNKCGCTFACTQATGSHIALCVNDAGTGCVYAASAALTYGFPTLGSCTTSTDILGNLDVRGKWQ